MISASMLAFVYAVLATPFLVWSFFRYNAFKSQQVYFDWVEEAMVGVESDIKRLRIENEKLQNEISSIKLKAGFSGEKEKGRLF
jgi:hypothetical protein